jgi:hypothetical protein
LSRLASNCDPPDFCFLKPLWYEPPVPSLSDVLSVNSKMTGDLFSILEKHPGIRCQKQEGITFDFGFVLFFFFLDYPGFIVRSLISFH